MRITVELFIATVVSQHYRKADFFVENVRHSASFKMKVFPRKIETSSFLQVRQ